MIRHDLIACPEQLNSTAKSWSLIGPGKKVAKIFPILFPSHPAVVLAVCRDPIHMRLIVSSGPFNFGSQSLSLSLAPRLKMPLGQTPTHTHTHSVWLSLSHTHTHTHTHAHRAHTHICAQEPMWKAETECCVLLFFVFIRWKSRLESDISLSISQVLQYRAETFLPCYWAKLGAELVKSLLF